MAARRSPRRSPAGTGRCRTTGKVRYQDAITAGKAQERLATQGRHVRAYLCQWCGQWHHATIHDDEQDAA